MNDGYYNSIYIYCKKKKKRQIGGHQIQKQTGEKKRIYILYIRK